MRLKRKPLILLFILPLFVSCLNNEDFDQINFEPTPTITAPLVFFELNQLDFFDDVTNTEITVVTDITDLDFFETSTVRDNLERFDINYEITKTFDRAFTILIEHLNDNGTVIFTHESIDLSQFSRELNETLTVDLNVNPEVLNTTRLRATVTLLPGGPALDPTIENEISFKSIGTFFLRL